MTRYVLIKGNLATGEKMQVDGPRDTPFTDSCGYFLSSLLLTAIKKVLRHTSDVSLVSISRAKGASLRKSKSLKDLICRKTELTASRYFKMSPKRFLNRPAGLPRDKRRKKAIPVMNPKESITGLFTDSPYLDIHAYP